jgi:N-acetylmuramoyl-L-alanine amidase
VKSVGDDALSFILADLQRSEAHADSSRLAYAVQEALVSATQASDRGVQQAPFFVLMGLQAPAILVEAGFLSHPEEGKRLRQADYQDTLAEAIAAGVKRFLAQMAAREGRPTP